MGLVRLASALSLNDDDDDDEDAQQHIHHTDCDAPIFNELATMHGQETAVKPLCSQEHNT